MVVVDMSKASNMSFAGKLAKLLLEENKKGKSWRVIARQYFRPKIINYATLNRFAKSGGKWMPKNKKILAALGLIKPPKSKQIADMSSKELLWCLENRK